MSRVSAFRWAKGQDGLGELCEGVVRQATQNLYTKQYAHLLNGFAGERICVKDQALHFQDRSYNSAFESSNA